ncbi:MAG: gliding motility lipoprotein GldH [Fulvivirga sp.]|nr:gliding motility lipoprotein GldH [Fulvivirga sp.]
MKPTYFIFFTLLAFFSCDNERLYEKNVDFDKRIWLEDSAVQLNFVIPQNDLGYDLYFNVRNTNTYPYHNLYIRYELADSTGKLLTEDLVNYFLFHEKTGEPYGAGLGDIFSHQFLLIDDYEFPYTGPYQMKIRQFMRQDSLKGIISAGLRVE